MIFKRATCQKWSGEIICR